jgi:predicted TIM-barrel fold metal-dependent hydrolase
VDLNFAVARAYNDWVHDVFAPEPERYVAAAFVPVDDVHLAVAEAQRCIDLGFKTVMLPCSYPWRPYDRLEYEPLWSLLEEAGTVLNFHVFTGNVFFGTDFASVDGMSVEEFAMRRESARVIEERMERLSTTVIGMAAGMGPIVHLTGGGALERHPRLKFVVTEAEAGWLGWTLHAASTRAQHAVDARERLFPPPGRGDDHRRSGRVEQPRHHRHRLHSLGERLPAR